MVKRLLKAGHSVNVYDIEEDRSLNGLHETNRLEGENTHEGFYKGAGWCFGG